MKSAQRVATGQDDRGWAYAAQYGMLVAALVALHVARPLWPSESAARMGDGLPMVMLWLLLALAWLGLAMVPGRMSFRWHWIDLAVLALIASQSVAAIHASRHDAARPAINMLWEWLALGVGYWLARQLIRSALQARGVIAVMIALAAAISLHGLYQYFVSLPATRAQYAANPDALLRQEGLWFPPGSVERELFEQRLFSTEPLATFALTNSLAAFLTPWLVIAAGVLLSLRPSDREMTRQPAAAMLSLAIIGACLVLTKSRSAYVGAGLGLAAAAVAAIRARRRLNWPIVAVISGLILLIALAAAAVNGLDWEVLAEAPKSLGYRWQYWRATALTIREHPWLGIGGGNFADHYTRYKLPTASEEIADPHNLLLEVWATGGIIALTGLLAVIVGLMIAFAGRRGITPSTPSDTVAGVANRAELRGIRWIFAGGASGYLLALVLPVMTGPLLEVPLLPLTAICELIAGAAILWLWYPWIISGNLPRGLAAAAALALIVNLLAAGGISFPAVAGSLWLLAAIATNLAAPGKSITLGKLPTLACWSVTLLLVAACFISAYRPVLSSQRWMAAAASAAVDGRTGEADEDLRKAAQADRYSAAPWVALADLRLQVWRQRPSQAGFDALEQALLKAVALRPRQASLWLRLGDGYREGFLKLKDQALPRKAVDCYREAVRLYPNHARERARLALGLDSIGQRDAARQQAATAIRLDAITPHADQKLRPELREELAAAGLMENSGTTPVERPASQL